MTEHYNFCLPSSCLCFQEIQEITDCTIAYAVLWALYCTMQRWKQRTRDGTQSSAPLGDLCVWGREREGSSAHLPVRKGPTPSCSMTPTEQHSPSHPLLHSSWLLHDPPWRRTCHPHGKQRGREVDHTGLEPSAVTHTSGSSSLVNQPQQEFINETCLIVDSFDC